MGNHKRPLCEGGVLWFAVCLYGFLGVIVLVYLREVGFALSLSLAMGGGWGVGGLRVGWGWVVLPFPGESWRLFF